MQFTEEHIRTAAIAAHNVNRAYCKGLGDDSQQRWGNAPDWQKESGITGVKFLIENPEAPDSATHDSWWAQKKAEGWVHGPVKDPEKKEHPCCVPYDDLPVAQQMKDRLFKSTVRGVLSHVTLGL